MNLADKKETLIHIVQEADDKLTGLPIALANQYNDGDEYFSKRELDFFEERKKTFYSSNREGSTVEDAHNRIRRNFSNGL